MNEYRKFRCCMCPNSYKNPMSKKCPPGLFKNEVTPCRFVKAYVDERGWKGVRSFKWRETFDEAQTDLNEHAREKGWNEIDL